MAFRLVALGDSTVEGLMDPGAGSTYVGWADRFAQRLAADNPGLLYANLAVRGQTSREVADTQLGPALAMRPDLALFMAGVNDLLRPRLDRGRLRDDLLTTHRELTESGARVLTFTMPDMRRVAPLTYFIRSRIDHLNAVVREAGATYGATVVDFAAEPLAGHPALWHEDRLHANSDGHRRIAEALVQAYGLEGEDWRTALPVPSDTGRIRAVAREVSWIGHHMTPWVWGRVRRHDFATGGRCKRPELTPFG